ncbi:hypothetical protein IV54_GL000762 [Levilactobacillus paucivorans]|uniref:DUF5776 domain-containing protein n=1 Tax=Levilactobacillus paucivorans TaxID=616990 RepID=A0A0R2LTS0_9LACO|nr:DUF5776 domain-containing protein [Levilactobacillus paucivorans]KRO04873.1 hypothetical protein IV54_GL000762 [Levilactobacillus paucivorans]
MRLTKFFITTLATLSLSLLGSFALPTISNNSETVARADDTGQNVSVDLILNKQVLLSIGSAYVQNQTTVNDIFAANESTAGATKGSLALEIQLASYVANHIWTAKQAGVFLSNFSQNGLTSDRAEQEISYFSSYYDYEASHFMLDMPTFESMLNEPIASDDQTQDFTIKRDIPINPAPLTMAITYKINDGTALPAETFKDIEATTDDQSKSFSKSITGADKQVYTDTDHMLIPKVPGYTANKSSVTFDESKVDASSGVQPVTVTYIKNSSTPVTPAPTPSTPATFQVYGKQKFYSYQNVDFKKSERVKKYAKKPSVYAPVFTVVKTTQSKAGTPRYQLSDGTYITAKSAYVGKLFLRKNVKTLYVTNPRGTWTHGTVMFYYPTQLLHHLNQGTKVTVTHLIKNGPVTRYMLADGTFITGNKSYVTTTKPKKVIHVKARDGRNLYSDVNLTHRLKHYRKGHIFTVKSWDYSHGHNLSVSGTKRYKVAGGYITGNPKLVKIVK